MKYKEAMNSFQTLKCTDCEHERKVCRGCLKFLCIKNFYVYYKDNPDKRKVCSKCVNCERKVQQRLYVKYRKGKAKKQAVLQDNHLHVE
jgi:hypothetical protein